MEEEGTNSNEAQAHQTSKWLLVLLLFSFPPAAWYLMWKQERYHKWFAYVLWIFGGMSFLAVLTQIIFVMPKLMNLYNDVGVKPENTGAVMVYSGMVMSFIQVIFGIFVYRKTREGGRLSNKILVLTVLILVSNLLIGALMQSIVMMSFVAPLYNLTSEL